MPAPKVRSEQWGEGGRVGQLPIAALRRPVRKMILQWQTLPLVMVHRLYHKLMDGTLTEDDTLTEDGTLTDVKNELLSRARWERWCELTARLCQISSGRIVLKLEMEMAQARYYAGI